MRFSWFFWYKPAFTRSLHLREAQSTILSRESKGLLAKHRPLTFVWDRLVPQPIMHLSNIADDGRIQRNSKAKYYLKQMTKSVLLFLLLYRGEISTHFFHICCLFKCVYFRCYNPPWSLLRLSIRLEELSRLAIALGRLFYCQWSRPMQ